MRHGPAWRRLAEVVQEERRVGRGVERELAVLDGEADARGAGGPSSPAAARRRRVAGELAGLGLAVAVADPQPGRLVPGAEHLGVERLAGGDQSAQRGDPPRPRAVGDHAVLGRRHAEHVHALALGDLEPLGGVEAGVVQQGGGAAQPRRDEGVARRLRPARGGGAPDEVALLRGQPVLGLQALAGQVALPVQHRLGLARGARGEGDQARVAGLELGRRRRVSGRQAPPWRPQVGRPSRPPRARRGCARRDDHQLRPGPPSRSRRSFGRSCSVHGRTA